MAFYSPLVICTIFIEWYFRQQMYFLSIEWSQMFNHNRALSERWPTIRGQTWATMKLLLRSFRVITTGPGGHSGALNASFMTIRPTPILRTLHRYATDLQHNRENSVMTCARSLLQNWPLPRQSAWDVCQAKWANQVRPIIQNFAPLGSVVTSLGATLPSHVGKSEGNYSGKPSCRSVVHHGRAVIHPQASVTETSPVRLFCRGETGLWRGDEAGWGLMAIHPCNTGGTSSLGPGQPLSAALLSTSLSCTTCASF